MQKEIRNEMIKEEALSGLFLFACMTIMALMVMTF